METAPKQDTAPTAEAPPPKETSPMTTNVPEATRLKKWLVWSFIGAAVFFLFLGVAGITTKKRARGEEMSTPGREATYQTSPQPPEHVTKAVGTYLELLRTKSATGIGSPAGQRPGEGRNGSKDDDDKSKDSEEQRKKKEHEQVAKDAASAVTSPITFTQGESVSEGRTDPPHPSEQMLPSLQGGLERQAELVTGNGGSGSDDQNLQGEKRGFSGERGNNSPYLRGTLVAPLSPYEIKAGSILPALLITGVNSDLPGQLVAQLGENVFDTVTGNHLLLPQGTRIIGEYDSKVAFGQERVLVVWTRLILPNGESLALEGMPGADLSGYAGMTGNVNNHYGKLVTGVVLGSIIGAGAQVAVGGQGAPIVPPSFGQLAVSGAAQNINQTAQQHTQKILNLQPTIEVAPGEKINVFVTRDMILKPYTE